MTSVNEVRDFIRERFDASDKYVLMAVLDVPGVLLVETGDATFQVAIDVVEVG